MGFVASCVPFCVVLRGADDVGSSLILLEDRGSPYSDSSAAYLDRYDFKFLMPNG